MVTDAFTLTRHERCRRLPSVGPTLSETLAVTRHMEHLHNAVCRHTAHRLRTHALFLTQTRFDERSTCSCISQAPTLGTRLTHSRGQDVRAINFGLANLSATSESICTRPRSYAVNSLGASVLNQQWLEPFTGSRRELRWQCLPRRAPTFSWVGWAGYFSPL